MCVVILYYYQLIKISDVYLTSPSSNQGGFGGLVAISATPGSEFSTDFDIGYS